MTEHTALPWRCGITNADRHRVSVLLQTPDGNMILKATGLPKRGVMLANARLIVTACNCHADLLEALERMDEMLDMLCKKINWETSFLDADTLREFNEAPIQAKRIIIKVKEAHNER